MAFDTESEKQNNHQCHNTEHQLHIQTSSPDHVWILCRQNLGKCTWPILYLKSDLVKLIILITTQELQLKKISQFATQLTVFAAQFHLKLPHNLPKLAAQCQMP